MAWRLEELSGSKGVAAVRAVLDAREGAALNRRLEVKLARLLRESDLPPPVRQYEVVGGGFEAHLDFAWPAPKVALEGDGFRDHGKKSQFVRDRRRLAHLASLGWLVVPVAWEDVLERPADVLARLRGALALRAAVA